MPAIEPNAPPPAPEPDGDPDVRVLIFGSNRLIEGLNRRTKTTIIAVPLADRIALVRDFMSAWGVTMRDLAAPETPIDAAAEPESPTTIDLEAVKKTRLEPKVTVRTSDWPPAPTRESRGSRVTTLTLPAALIAANSWCGRYGLDAEETRMLSFGDGDMVFACVPPPGKPR